MKPTGGRNDSVFRTLIPMYTFAIVYSGLYPDRISNYAGVMAFPAIAIGNLMASKIYRKTRLGIHTASETDFSEPSRALVFNPIPSNFTREVGTVRMEERSMANHA